MVVSPYGEGRRLAYFRLICTRSEKFLPCDLSFLVEAVLAESSKMHGALQKYKRITGKMGTKNVCYNYLRFCSWMDFLKIEGRVVSKNASTVFFSTLSTGQGFNLSPEEKLAYFIHLWSRVPVLRDLLQALEMSKPLPSGKLRIQGMTEHQVESYVEWFVDLDLATPTKRRFGAFYLSDIGNDVRLQGDNFERACCAYASRILGEGVEPNAVASDDYIWREMKRLAKELSPHIRSPVDPKLMALVPILLHLQIRLLTDKQSFVPLEKLVRMAQRTTSHREASLTWDPAYKAGFLRFR